MSSNIDLENIGEDVPLLEGIRTACAIRRLKPDPVPPALIRKVCAAGTFAPSGGNRQPWFFIAVTEPDRRAWVAERYRKRLHGVHSTRNRSGKEIGLPRGQAPQHASAIHLAEHLHEVPCICSLRGGPARCRATSGAVPGHPEHPAGLSRRRLGGVADDGPPRVRARSRSLVGSADGCPSAALVPIGWPARGYRWNVSVRRKIRSEARMILMIFERYGVTLPWEQRVSRATS